MFDSNISSRSSKAEKASGQERHHRTVVQQKEGPIERTLETLSWQNTVLYTYR